MAHRPRKKITFAIGMIALLLVGGYLFWKLSPSIYYIHYRDYLGTTQCTFGNWESFDMPALTKEWEDELMQAGLKATGVSASGVGESESCIAFTWLGMVNKSKPASAAAQTNVYATIRVDTISDDAALGEIVIKILAALEPVKPYSHLEIANIHLVFVAEQSKSIDFYLNPANDLHKQGLTSTELFQALDGRYTPPTATPSPTKK